MSLVLVTGVGGFIGSHVARQLLQQGHSVRGLLYPGESTTNIEDLKLERVEGDVRDLQRMKDVAAGCEAVFHLASIYAVWTASPTRFLETNVGGTRNVLDAARHCGVERTIVTTSQAVWAGTQPATTINEATPPNEGGCLDRLGDLYCSSKLEVHRLVEERAAEGQDVLCVAPAVPFGPADLRPTPTGQILTSVVNMPAFTFIESVVNVIDVRDVAAGHILAWQRGTAGETYLLGGEDNISMAELVAEVKRVSGSGRPAFRVPYFAAAITAHLLTWWANWISRKPPLIAPGALRVARIGFRLDCSKARTELGLRPRPWQESVRDALIWFAANGYLTNRHAVRTLEKRVVGEAPQVDVEAA